jgi:hypothetical protein
MSALGGGLNRSTQHFIFENVCFCQSGHRVPSDTRHNRYVLSPEPGRHAVRSLRDAIAPKNKTPQNAVCRCGVRVMPLLPFLVAAGILLLSALLYAQPVLGPPHRLSMVTDFHSLPPPWRGPAFPTNWAPASTPPSIKEPVRTEVMDSEALPATRAILKKVKPSKVAKGRYSKVHKKYLTRSAKRFAARHRSRI